MPWPLVFAEALSWADVLISVLGAGGIGGIVKTFLDVRQIKKSAADEIERRDAELKERDERILRLQKEHGDALLASAAHQSHLEDRIQSMGLELADAVLHCEHFGAELVRITGSSPPPAPPWGSKEAKKLLSKSGIYRPDEEEIKTGGRLLFVEDNDDVRRQVSRLLKSHGYEVFPAGSVMQALAAIDEYGRLFNLVVLDLMLLDHVNGNVGGDLVAAHLRSRGIKAPILIVTAMDEFQARGYVKSTGAVGLVTKPYEFATLLQAIAENIRSA